MKKKIYGVLMAAAVLSIATAGIGKANAYFTTYATAAGQRTINLGDETTVHEDVTSSEKVLTFQNSSTSREAVYVRARAYAPSEIEGALEYSSADQKWVKGTGDWYYYTDPVAPGVTLDGDKALHIKIESPVADKEEEEFNVIVVYETIPAADDTYDTADWTQAKQNGWSLDEE